MNSRIIAASAFGLWATTSGITAAQPTASDTLLPIEGGFLESFQGATRLRSVEGVFGVEFDQSNAAFDAEAIYVHLAEDFSGLLCLQINSIDGDYWAEVQYDLSGMEAGMRRLTFQTDYAEELALYSSEDIAVLATIRPDCNERVEAVLLTSFKPSLPEEFMFYLSGGDYRMSVIVPHSEGGEVTFSCEEMSDSTVFRIYDVKCVLPVNSMLDYSRAEVKRSLFGATNTPRPIRLPLNVPE